MKYLSEEKAEREAENEVYHIFNLKRELLWDEITKDIKKLPENLSNALIKIADLNRDLKGVIDKFSFLGFTTQEHREKLRQLVELFNQYNFDNKYVSSEIVGDAYEHILRKFIPMTKKEAKQGEYYTPREVVRLLVEILDPNPGQSICDPACGFGGMLVVSYKYVKEKYGKERSLLLFGQEYSSEIYGLMKMNLITHGIVDAFVEWGDSLLYPRFVDEGKLKQFYIVIANPPWNQDGYGEEVLKRGEFRERYSYGYPPKAWADWAWVQHMLATSRGKVGIVLDQGVLTRSNEISIRSKIVNSDLIECIILLPAKLFYNTQAAGVIIVFNRSKSEERKGKILFVNASEEYVKHPQVRRLNMLSAENIQRIADCFRHSKEIRRFSKIVGLERIRTDPEYSLNVADYVPLQVEEEELDLGKWYVDFEKLEQERKQIEQEVAEYVRVLEQSITNNNVGFKETPIGKIAEDWDIMKLGDTRIAKIIMGTSPPSSTYNKNGDGVPFLQGAAEFGEIYPVPLMYCSKPVKLAEKDDVLISVRAPVGEVNFAPSKCCIGRGLAAIRPNSSVFNPRFAFYYLKYASRRLVGRGSTFGAIRKRHLENFLIALPPKPVQDRIASMLSAIEEQIQKESRKLEYVRTLKNGLLKLFHSGRIGIT